MHAEGVVAEASERVKRAGLIPPVKVLESRSDLDPEADPADIDETEWVFIGVTGPVTPELEATFSEVLHGLRYKVTSVPVSYGASYRREG